VSSVGKVLLAELSDPELTQIIETEGLPRYTANTIVTPDALREELQRVRDRGWAEDLEEAVRGVCCVAAPIRSRGRVVAALSVVQGPTTFEHNRDRHRAEVVAVARSLST
jgi:IclR family KDG regulon transcriptional repressor